MFTTTLLQTFTYLFAVCLFSIAFLVFVNSSISFVVADLIEHPGGAGDAVGTLGFADELLALVACPAWGILSDTIGVRYVCTAGYAIIALSLALLVQAKNVYPQLLLGRLFFSLGGAAVSTMVTAVLPSISGLQRDDTAPATGHGARPASPVPTADEHGASSTETSRHSMSSELTITPALFRGESSNPQRKNEKIKRGSPSRLAGFVGTLTGCGAVVALLVFLPLPALFEKKGQPPGKAIQSSYYVVASLALIVSMICFVGLRHLPEGHEDSGDLGRTAYHLGPGETGVSNKDEDAFLKHSRRRHFTDFGTSFLLGFKHADIGLGYIGGFVARASSVGISLFIPLYINQYYRRSGLCQEENSPGGLFQPSGTDLGSIKKSCPRAYIAASILTGVSQLIALCCAPVFGYFSEKSTRYHVPLLLGALSGIVGYPLLAFLPYPNIEGNVAIFVAMAFIGTSQIGAIVCSLAVLSSGVLGIKNDATTNDPPSEPSEPIEADGGTSNADPIGDEQSPLLPRRESSPKNSLVHLKGSMAGVYSLYGGAGILFLTKAGGLMFDKVSPQSPFCILTCFNGLLLLVGSIGNLRRSWRSPR